MFVNVKNKRTHQMSDNDMYIGRGPNQVHMLTPGMKMHQPGWLGSPVVIGLECFNCGKPHIDGGSTLLCFSTLFQAKMKLNAEFAQEMQSWRACVRSDNTQNDELNLVCWCNPDPCHGNVIREWLCHGKGKIGFTRQLGVYAWMSNMSSYAVELDGIRYKTAEHAYMCAKTLELGQKRWVMDAPSPEEAKKRGRNVTLRGDWDQVKVDIMEEILRAKIKTNPILGDELKATAGNELIELTWWHDTFWGVCSCSQHKFHGENKLGQLWMKVRDK